MSNESTDRLERVDTAIGLGRDAFDGVIDGSSGTDGEARADVRTAMADVDARVDDDRERTRAHSLVH